MNKTIPRNNRFPLAPAIILLGLLFIFASCGGGGGGGGGSISGITYDGPMTQAAISAVNANAIFSAVWNLGVSSESGSLSSGSGSSGSDSSGSVSFGTGSLSKTYSAKSSKDTGAAFFKQITRRALSDAKGYAAPSTKIMSAAAVNETHYGLVSGTLTITGDIDPNTGTGSLTMTYSNFNDGDGVTYNGIVTVSVAGFDMGNGVMTDGTLSFTLWTITSASGDVSLTGSMRLQENLQNNTDALTINLDGRDNSTRDTFRYQNFVVTTVYDNIFFPTTMTETDTGRAYLGQYGYVEVTTTTPLTYASSSQENPNSGGPIILSGAGGSRAAVTPIASSYVKIEVDADGDGIYESKNLYAWSDLAGEPVANVPVANAGPDQSVATGATVTLNGSGSMDLLGNSLTYSWSMTTRPGTSAAVLSDPTSTVTTFFVDQPGTYTVSLIVNNGSASSSPDTVVITATGPANSGLFKPYVAYPTGSWPEAVAIGDVNGDGRKDVVLVTSYYVDAAHDYKLFVFLQNASGGIDPPIIYPAGNGKSVAIGDLNGDGRADVVVTASNGIGVFYQNSSHGLDPMVTYASNHQSFSNTYKLKIGDFNHDGRLDVVSIDWGTQSYDVDIFYQNASGTFDTPVTYTVTHGGYDDLEVGDINNDGLTDIIVMSGQSLLPNIGVLIQKPDGSFNSPIYYSVGQNILTQGVGVGDVDGDLLSDIIVTYGGNAGEIGVFTQNNSGTLNSVVSHTAYDCPGPVEIADVTGDGKKDIVVAHGGWNALGVYLQNSSGVLQPEELYPIPYATNYNPHGIAVGDINGDGRNDVVIADYNNGLVVLYHK